MLIAAIAMIVGVTWPASALASGCSDSWQSPVSGNWSDKDAWSTGVVPTSSDDVCITVPGSYTVTISGAANAQSVTVGTAGGSGTQTLLVQGQSVPSGGSVISSTLFVSQPSMINTSAVLDLDSDSITPVSPSNGSAGYADIQGAGTVTNYGTIRTSVEPASVYDSSSLIYVRTPIVNEPGGLFDVSTGPVDMSEGTSFTNGGTVEVDAGSSAEPASLGVGAGPDGGVSFVNNGTVMDNGSIGVTNESTWTQNGPETGAAVTITGNSLTDQSGGGSFTLIGEVALSGTIPAGQTIAGTGTTIDLTGAQVVNDGTLALTTGATGGSAIVDGSPLVNHGTITTNAPSGGNVGWREPFTNASGGTLDVQSGQLYQSTGTATINDGTISVAAGANYDLLTGLQGSSGLTNDADGTLAFGIASAASYGTISFNGAPFTLSGGTGDPVLAAGYTPAAGTEFPVITGADPGHFTTVANGFTADYGSSTGISLRYGSAPTTTTTSPTTTPPAQATASLTGTPRGSATEVTDKIRCRGTAGKTCVVSETLTVLEKIKGTKRDRIVVGAKVTRIAVGKTATVAFTLNAEGRALLKRSQKLSVKLTITSKTLSGKTLTVATRTLILKR